MKKFIMLFFLTGFTTILAQQIRENPEIPKNRNYGRVLKLQEVMQIEGEGEKYYHNGANKLQFGEDGCIYASDSVSASFKAHLLKFSPDGKFIKDFYRQGEGPGEILSWYDFVVSGSNVFVLDNAKRKIVLMDDEGNFIQEFKNTSHNFRELFGIYKGRLVFFRMEYPVERKTTRLYDVKNIIVLAPPDGTDSEDIHAFVSQQLIIAQGGGGMMVSQPLFYWDPFHAVMGDGKLYACRSREYLIEILDLESGAITARFKRKYSRVPREMEDWEKYYIAKYKAPRRKFESDINDLSYGRGLLWVHTSLQDEEKGRLFDIFDSKGRFVDSFFINVNGHLLSIDSDHLYFSQSDEEDLPLIVKYKILEPVGSH